MSTNQDGFLKYLLQHQTELRAFIGSMLRDREERDDCFQEVAIALWNQFDQFDESKSFGAWARGVAAHKILRTFRSKKRQVASLDPKLIEAMVHAFERIEREAEERKDALSACLEMLPPTSQKMLSFKYADDLGVAEIADLLNQSTDAIYQSLSRLRTRLAECIERRLLRGGQYVSTT